MKKEELKRDLGLFQLTLAGVGIILGAGVYALIGVAAGIAGNAVWMSFLFSAIVALFTGLSYAELSSMFKGDAAEFDYLRAGLNKHIGFWLAMSMIFGAIISAAAVALGFAGYFIQLVPMPLIAAAVLLLLVTGIINLVGIKEVSLFNTVAVIAEVAGLFIIILLGLGHYGSVDYLELANGFEGIFKSAALIFFAFLGFESIVKLRAETKNPEKTVPKAVIYSIIITSVIYVLVALAAVSVVGWETLSASDAPLATVAQAVFGNSAFLLLTIIALFSTANTVLIINVASSRQIYGIAKENSLPKILSYVNPKTNTPVIAILATLVIALIFALIGDISIVANLTNFFIFLTFAAVNLSLIMLRYNHKGMHRGFRCPGNIGKFPLIALFGLITSLGMLVFVVWNLI